MISIRLIHYSLATFLIIGASDKGIPPILVLSRDFVLPCEKAIYLISGTIRIQMKAPWTDPSLRELLALAALAAFGCGLALAQGDFLFAVVFCAASVVAIIEAILRSR